ncbi:MAG TPA: hypothetical protein VF155_10665 [Candidatus Dormibacteraeota bacterium]
MPLLRMPRPHRVAQIYRQQLSPPRERQFLASIGFFTAFAVCRTITHAIRAGVGPFHNVSLGGRHLHHLVFGILGLLGTGYLWLVQMGTGLPGRSKAASQASSIAYGASSALTLDEFALWLNLEDVYWAKQGRESVDAVILFGALLSIGLWGGSFFRGLVREARRV